MVAGLRSIGGGDAQTQLNTLKEVVNDLGESVGDDDHFIKKVFCSIKNLMSDRCATQKKFNKIFSEFRCSVLPDIVTNWDTLTSEHQQKMKTVNDFYCGLHFLVALGDQAEASLKIWENLLFDDVSKVGSLAHGGYSKGDSGTLRLIKSVCKSVSERGCEREIWAHGQFCNIFKGKFQCQRYSFIPIFGK